MPNRNWETQLAVICGLVILILGSIPFFKKINNPKLLLAIFLVNSVLTAIPKFFVMMKEKRESANIAIDIESYHQSFLAKKKSQEKEAAIRIKNKNPFTFHEGIVFLSKISQWDLSHRATLPNYLPEAGIILKNLIDKKILNPNLLNDEGVPLYYAYLGPRLTLSKTVDLKAQEGDIFLLKVLVENGADLELKDSQGKSFGEKLNIQL